MVGVLITQIRPLRGLTVKSASGMPPTHFVDPFIVRGPLGVENLLSCGVRGAREAENLVFYSVRGSFEGGTPRILPCAGLPGGGHPCPWRPGGRNTFNFIVSGAVGGRTTSYFTVSGAPGERKASYLGASWRVLGPSGLNQGPKGRGALGRRKTLCFMASGPLGARKT